VDQAIPNNQINLLQNGEAYFAAIEAAFEHAAQEIFLESYIFKADDTGWRIAKALRGAALRGVKTRLLIDGFGSHGLPKSLIDYIASAGVMLLDISAQDITLDIAAPKVAPLAPENCDRRPDRCFCRRH
jgi:phosphatidylserine/phosphatidylglycerophosphate/cardiolipin synthase-like enzyme